MSLVPLPHQRLHQFSWRLDAHEREGSQCPGVEELVELRDIHHNGNSWVLGKEGVVVEQLLQCLEQLESNLLQVEHTLLLGASLEQISTELVTEESGHLDTFAKDRHKGNRLFLKLGFERVSFGVASAGQHQD